MANVRNTAALIRYDDFSEHELLFKICASAMNGNHEAYHWLKGDGCIKTTPTGIHFKFFSSARDGEYLKEWRASVFRRDGYKCAVCGNTKFLHAHHIIPWAKDPDRRFELSNGITLCKYCHSQQHPECKHLILNVPSRRQKR